MENGGVRLVNHQTGEVFFDTLHRSASKAIGCSPSCCGGSVVQPDQHHHVPVSQDSSSTSLIEEAMRFIEAFYAHVESECDANNNNNNNNKKNINNNTECVGVKARCQQVQREIRSSGTFQLSYEELVYACHMAWRNEPRCVGRIHWKKLMVFDFRHVDSLSEMFECICRHIQYATNEGQLRSTASIFPASDGSGKRPVFRIWNRQLVSYAGHRRADGSVCGDPLNVDLTQICCRLGWRPAGTAFDILPIVLSRGEQVQYFCLPRRLPLIVPIKHPSCESLWQRLGLQWYALPAVSNMSLTVCGDLRHGASGESTSGKSTYGESTSGKSTYGESTYVNFPTVVFSGWYVSSEVAVRDLCDPHRYNLLQPIAECLGLDTCSQKSLWKDRALVEISLAVLHSFQASWSTQACLYCRPLDERSVTCVWAISHWWTMDGLSRGELKSAGVTMVDHHTVSESFMRFMRCEHKTRGGCPADWLWLNPPLSSASTPLFHQEMLRYSVTPAFTYHRHNAWHNTDLLASITDSCNASEHRLNRHNTGRKMSVRALFRVVLWCCRSYSAMLSHRPQVTVLCGSQSGTALAFCESLVPRLASIFRARLVMMSEFVVNQLSSQKCVLVVTSTFGNGDPPDNAVSFYQQLCDLADCREQKKLSDIENISADDIKFFSVLSLGSSAYPNFCTFGTNVDHLLGELFGQRLLANCCVDETGAPQRVFNKWCVDIVQKLCHVFAVTCERITTLSPLQAALNSAHRASLVESDPVNNDVIGDVIDGEGSDWLRVVQCRLYSSHVTRCQVKARHVLHAANNRTVQVVLTQRDSDSDSDSDSESLIFSPGHHAAVVPVNPVATVNAVLQRINTTSCNRAVTLRPVGQRRPESGNTQSWWLDRLTLPPLSIACLLTNFLDISAAPSRRLLASLLLMSPSQQHRAEITALIEDEVKYRRWVREQQPNLADTLHHFDSLSIDCALLLANLPIISPRLYSISSSAAAHPGQLHLTVTVLQQRQADGLRKAGLCSNYLDQVQIGSHISIYIRRSGGFQLPASVGNVANVARVLLVAHGAGIAPFRAFWQHVHALRTEGRGDEVAREMHLFYGCRSVGQDLYAAEKRQMSDCGVVTSHHRALSRQPGVAKRYVQDLLEAEAALTAELLLDRNAHVFVCGSCSMAAGVVAAFQRVLASAAHMSDTQADSYINDMRMEGRLHEDIFGAS